MQCNVEITCLISDGSLRSHMVTRIYPRKFLGWNFFSSGGEPSLSVQRVDVIQEISVLVAVLVDEWCGGGWTDLHGVIFQRGEHREIMM